MKNVLMFLLTFLSYSSSFALDQIPQCYNGARAIQVMNENVIQYKQTLPNLKKVQVLVKTNFVKMLPKTSNRFGEHLHFIVSLKDFSTAQSFNSEAFIEVAHSMNGYTSPTEADLQSGPVYICAEYSTTRSDGYPRITKFKPSETGAMLHWTHQADRSAIDQEPVAGHPSGWIYANGKLFGKKN